MLRTFCSLLLLLACASGPDARAVPARDATLEAVLATPDDLRRMLPPTWPTGASTTPSACRHWSTS